MPKTVKEKDMRNQPLLYCADLFLFVFGYLFKFFAKLVAFPTILAEVPIRSTLEVYPKRSIY